MAAVDQLAKLFEAVAHRDWGKAEQLSRGIADAEERLGHHGAAQRLRGALRSNGYASPAPPAGPPYDAFVLTTALSRAQADVLLRDVVLSRLARTQLGEIALEWRRREHLSKQGIPRRSRMLFHGPPGCGKSVTAKALGEDLDLPVYVTRLDALVGAYLGQTALRVRELFRFAQASPCIVLLDEIDALGKQRGNPLDVGELDRVVVALLQELEHSNPAGYVIATSNLPTTLDRAIWRRFDLILEFPRPSQATLKSYATTVAKRHPNVRVSR